MQYTLIINNLRLMACRKGHKFQLAAWIPCMCEYHSGTHQSRDNFEYHLVKVLHADCGESRGNPANYNIFIWFIAKLKTNVLW